MNPDVSQIHQEGPFRLATLLHPIFFIALLILFMNTVFSAFNISQLYYLLNLESSLMLFSKSTQITEGVVEIIFQNIFYLKYIYIYIYI